MIKMYWYYYVYYLFICIQEGQSGLALLFPYIYIFANLFWNKYPLTHTAVSQLIIWGCKANRRSRTGPARVAELQRPCVQVQKVHCPCCTSLSFQCPDGRLSSGKDAWIWSHQYGIELLKWIQSVLLLFIVVFPFYCLHVYDSAEEFQMISSPQLGWGWPRVTNPKGCQCQSLCQC